MKTNKLIRINTRVEVVLEDIIRVEGFVNYSMVYFKKSRPILFAKTLKEIEGLLPENFIRIHRSHIINMQYLDKHQIYTDVVHVNQFPIPVARRRKAFFNSTISN